MKAQKPRLQLSTAALVKRSFRLERQGRYAESLDLFHEDWRNRDFIPDVDHLEPAAGSEVLLRFASLIGFCGHLESTIGAQDRSRDLLMDVRARAFALENQHLAAASENSLALTYWRTGEFREAEIWLAESLSREIPRACDARLFGHVVSLLLNLSQRRHEENIDYARSVEDDFLSNGDPFLVGNLYSNLAISLKNTGRTDEALSYLNLARRCFEQARHWIYVTAVENNLALLHKNEARYDAAHLAVDSAISRYKKLKDRTREGSSLETKAQIFIDEGRYEDALAIIDRSISILNKSENHGYLAEAIATKAKILIALNNFADAMLTLSDAIDITRTHTGEPAARKMIADFESTLGVKRAAEPAPQTTPAKGGIELLIPDSFSADADYRGVWIHNSFLADIGVERGSLALVVTDRPKRGQPGAVMNNATREVTCGLFDAEFGMIGLDCGDHEPVVFSEDEVTVIGTIVGVCRKEESVDGKMIAEPLASRP